MLLMNWSRACLCGMALLAALALRGQCPAGSRLTNTINGNFTIGNGVSGLNNFQGNKLYIGPTADLIIHGELVLYVDSLIIHPEAWINGEGKITLRQKNKHPLFAGCPATPVYVDANGAALNVTLSIETDRNVSLADLAVTTAGANNLPKNNQATLQLNQDLLFAEAVKRYDNGGNLIRQAALSDNHLVLNAYDLRLSGQVQGYGPQRYVVTNGNGHMVWENLQAGIFPVGRAEADYTPARVEPASAATVHVAVKNYAEVQAKGIEIRDPNMGVDRVWSVFADSPVQANLTLQHNATTAQKAYNASHALISRYAGSAPNNQGGAASGTRWDLTAQPMAATNRGTLTTGAAIEKASEMSRSMSLPPAGANAWLTKATYRPNVLDKGPNLTTTVQLGDASFNDNEVKHFVINVYEINGVSTQGQISVTLLIPPGYELMPYNATLGTCEISGEGPKSVQNANWQVSSSTGGRLVIKSAPGVVLNRFGTFYNSIGLSMKRTTATDGSTGNITKIINTDPVSLYDTITADNLYLRILSAF